MTKTIDIFIITSNIPEADPVEIYYTDGNRSILEVMKEMWTKDVEDMQDSPLFNTSYFDENEEEGVIEFKDGTWYKYTTNLAFQLV